MKRKLGLARKAELMPRCSYGKKVFCAVCRKKTSPYGSDRIKIYGNFLTLTGTLFFLNNIGTFYTAALKTSFDDDDDSLFTQFQQISTRTITFKADRW